MEYIHLGRTGLRGSRLCLGTMAFGREADEPTSVRIMERALELGVNFIDTANVYGRPHRPYPIIPILGPRTLGQMEHSLRAAEVKLSEDVLTRLDAIWPGPGQAPEAYAW